MSVWDGTYNNQIGSEPKPEPDAEKAAEYRKKFGTNSINVGAVTSNNKTAAANKIIDPIKDFNNLNDPQSSLPQEFKQFLAQAGIEEKLPDGTHWSEQLVNPWKEPVRTFPIHEHGVNTCTLPPMMSEENHESFIAHLARVHHDIVQATIDFCWALDKLSYDAEVEVYNDPERLKHKIDEFDIFKASVLINNKPTLDIDFNQIVGYKTLNRMVGVKTGAVKCICKRCSESSAQKATRLTRTFEFECEDVKLIEAIGFLYKCELCKKPVYSCMQLR